MSTSTLHLGIFYMPQICDTGLTALLPLFSPWKILTASAGSEPANLGTERQHATPRPPKPLTLHLTFSQCAMPLLTETPTFYRDSVQNCSSILLWGRWLHKNTSLLTSTYSLLSWFTYHQTSVCSSTRWVKVTLLVSCNYVSIELQL
jgi:hypothetical protein